MDGIQARRVDGWIVVRMHLKVAPLFFTNSPLKPSNGVSFILEHVARDFQGICIKSSCGEKLYVFAMPHMGY